MLDDDPTDIPTIPEIPGWTIIDMLGRGGMGAVYRARSKTVNQLMALKVIDRVYADQPAFRRYFVREISTTVALHHPHILPILNYSPDPEAGPLYLATPIVGSDVCRSLADLLHLQGRLDPVTTASLLAQVCEALDYAHRHHPAVVHRDLSPSNILLNVTDDGQHEALLADFGIAYPLQDEARTAVTQSGSVVPGAGKPLYMAPEQFDDVEFGPITPRTDLYQLGIVAYECLTGELPYRETNPIRLSDCHRRSPLPPLTDVQCTSAAMRALVSELMAKQPGDRPADAATVRDRLRAISGEPPMTAAPATTSATLVQATTTPTTLSAVRPRRTPGGPTTPSRPTGGASPPPAAPPTTMPRRRSRLAGLLATAITAVVFITVAIAVYVLIVQPGSTQPIDPSPIAAHDDVEPPSDSTDQSVADVPPAEAPVEPPDEHIASRDEPADMPANQPATDPSDEPVGEPEDEPADESAGAPPPVSPQPVAALDPGPQRERWRALRRQVVGPTDELDRLAEPAEQLWQQAKTANRENDPALAAERRTESEEAFEDAIIAWRNNAPRSLVIHIKEKQQPEVRLTLTQPGTDDPPIEITIRTEDQTHRLTHAGDPPRRLTGTWHIAAATKHGFHTWFARDFFLGDARYPEFPEAGTDDSITIEPLTDAQTRLAGTYQAQADTLASWDLQMAAVQQILDGEQRKRIVDEARKWDEALEELEDTQQRQRAMGELLELSREWSEYVKNPIDDLTGALLDEQDESSPWMTLLRTTTALAQADASSRITLAQLGEMRRRVEAIVRDVEQLDPKHIRDKHRR
ncbi:MAG: protein kinase [Phycisphaerales bacterium]|nr:protein kinase [Phycisphaerales bacterium]